MKALDAKPIEALEHLRNTVAEEIRAFELDTQRLVLRVSIEHIEVTSASSARREYERAVHVEIASNPGEIA